MVFAYPAIDERNLNLIGRIFESNPEYFDLPECPYSQDTKNLFKGISKFQDFDVPASGVLPETDDLIQQISQLMKELRAYGEAIKDSTDTKSGDKNTYFRLSVTLLEKLLDLKEKSVNIKNYELFMYAVLDIMDRNCDADQRQEIMDRLKEFVATTEPTKGATNESNDSLPDTSTDI